MAENIKTIRIESILGGFAPSSHFARSNQFIASVGIDPGLTKDDSSLSFNVSGSCGLLRPASSAKLSSDLANPPMWIVGQPKFGGQRAYVYDASGSTFILETQPLGTLTALSDAGEMTGGAGNGCAYYDNYMYFAKATTIARYGPLDGTKGFDGTYWTGTLAKTALSNPAYPFSLGADVRLPNHVLHRHSDGKLYIADVVDNQGTLHYIRTTKTTAEGDTDNGSTYGALTIGRGLYPTAMESYGANLVVALYEGFASGTASILSPSGRAKIAFWDTTSVNFNQLIWVEFPDPIISAMKNVNGVLYVVSGNPNIVGFRLSRFVGGYTFEEVAYSHLSSASLAGAIDGDANRLLFGTFTTTPTTCAAVLSFGLQSSKLGQGLFGVMRATAPTANSGVTALMINKTQSFLASQPYIGWSDGTLADSTNNGIDEPVPQTSVTSYAGAKQIWWSQLYKVGKPFRVKNIRLPFGQAIAANMTLDVKIYTDDASSNYTGTTYGLPTVNNTNFPNSERYANFKVKGVEGYQNFFMELLWSGSALLTVNLPIEIDIEVIEDQ